MRAYEVGFRSSEQVRTNVNEQLASISVNGAVNNIAIPFILFILFKVVHLCLVMVVCSVRIRLDVQKVRKDERAGMTWTSEWSANESRLKPDQEEISTNANE